MRRGSAGQRRERFQDRLQRLGIEEVSRRRTLRPQGAREGRRRYRRITLLKS